ncbi:hypothetical protein BHE74_00009660 [Ensete ventricosum]|nr:hypothetical protein GW17_00008564 [Ensete ventricosum]RWW81907.1 hypothetical protein BHE74_00009660 [Ensete ventricosum]RZR87283.1 hypothetical protein BHM03_00014656 [Ensete ventricosum]
MFKRCDKIVIFQMTVTWTSGYGINEAEPFVEWGARGDSQVRSPAGTLTFSRNSMCGLYSTDYGMFHFCIADTEHDWRPGTEQYSFIEHCLSSVDRQKQPWLIFLAHRVLGYSSADFYCDEGTSEEPMGRESLQELWQKYKVDIAFFGHVHNYERTCPVYQRDGVTIKTMTTGSQSSQPSTIRCCFLSTKGAAMEGSMITSLSPETTVMFSVVPLTVAQEQPWLLEHGH